ncbi:MAG: hypothetical protein HC830_11430 [Bacteroidetes bacterium]|nr:hypothetical protein [Bacteroidota bacterium]
MFLKALLTNMTSALRIICGITLFAFVGGMCPVNAADNPKLKRFDESIFVISNFSGVDANLTETRSIQELLDANISGFRFHIDWEKNNNRLILKRNQ